ncbi:MAG: hypothetical protein CUN56_12260 [Phototrophicales bacterium]|nr:MAG: hypothetical protein CUN56_12260 [Phototrophicales bacterium]RMG76856.1 MAG: hypothetical protein D6711_03000 [Chloroflexota bacterium]
MLKLIILITPKIEAAHHLADEWAALGAPGVTFIESYGLHRLNQSKRKFEILPGMMSMLEILRNREESNVIMLSVVPENLVDPMLTVAQSTLGDLHAPDTGVAFIIDVAHAIGIRHNGKEQTD